MTFAAICGSGHGKVANVASQRTKPVGYRQFSSTSLVNGLVVSALTGFVIGFNL
jgi:hypothetical protein